MSEVNLTPKQAHIAQHIDGPLIVLAGAGAGKTATLVERTGRMIEENINPRNIMIVTFSLKAVKEVRSRLATRFGQDGEDAEVLTFHGFGYRFMRQYKEMFGLREDQEWVIMADNEQKRMLNEIAKPLGEKAEADGAQLRKAVKAGYSMWSLLKQRGVCPKNVSDALIALEKIRATQQGHTPNYEKVSLLDRLTAQTLVSYEKEKRDGGYLDFDDLLLLPTKALHKHPDIAAGLAQLHRYIMVDESQDTNSIQYLMIKSLGMNHKNVVMVGDDDQSIYGWRGARVANLRQFMKDFDAPIARLEQNFRSHSKIVNSAANLIKHNNARLSKKPFSAQSEGQLPEFRIADRDRTMARDITAQISELSASGVALSDIAILYRTNRMTTILEPAFKQSGIPYSVVGGMSFYERAEIQAVMACVRIAHKWDDYQALKSLQPYIDGLGKKGMSDSIERIKDNNENLLSLSVHDAPQQFGKGGIILQTFLSQLMGAVYGDSDRLTQYEQARKLIQWTKDGPMKLLDREKDDEARVKRSENLDQLIHEIREANPASYTDYLMEGPISDFIATKDGTDCVTLSTIHRSKGLEWPHVIIAGMSDGLMPLDQAKMSGKAAPQQPAKTTQEEEDGGKPEEERRLAYVAATRAAESLTMYHAEQYHFPGSEPAAVDPSPFIKEMGLQYTPAQKITLNNNRETNPNPDHDEIEVYEDTPFSVFN